MKLFPRFSLVLALVAFSGVALAQTENPGAPRQKKKMDAPKAEWLDSMKNAPNGTEYKTFTSKVLGHEVSYLVALPEGYESGTNRYPVVYWLHGMGGNQRAGALTFLPQFKEATKEGKVPPAIVILVNGMVKSFYVDSVSGQLPMESVIIKDLIPHVDATYRTVTKREARIIEGFSMGGYGAAHLGFKYPELFGTVVVDSGALLDPTLKNIPKDGPMYAVFGDDAEKRLAEHPKTLAQKNADLLRGKTRIRIGCGSIDGLLPVNKELHDLLTQLDIKHEYEVVPDVAHNPPLYYKTLGTKPYEFHGKSLGK